jgi:acetyl esterase/lipase
MLAHFFPVGLNVRNRKRLVGAIMRRLCVWILCAVAVWLPGTARAQEDGDALADAFAASPSMWDAQLSPQGRWVATGCGMNGQRSVCIYDLQGDSRPRLFAAPDNASLYDYYWVSDRHVLMDIRYRHVSESGEIYANGRGIVLDVETGDEAIFMRNHRNVYGNTQNVVSLNDSDPNSVIAELRLSRARLGRGGARIRETTEYNTALYRVDLRDGRAREIERVYSDVFRHILTADGEVVARVRLDIAEDWYAIENLSGRIVYEGQHGGRLPSVWGVVDGGAALGVYFSEGPHLGLARLDLGSGEIVPIEHPVSQHSDFGAVLDRWTEEFVGFSASRGNLPAHDFLDAELAEIQSGLTEVLSAHFGPTRVRLTSWTRDRSMLTAEARRPGLPAQYFLFERETNALSPLGSEADALDGVELGRVEFLTYQASDGMEIPAFLTLPPGQGREDGPFPLVVLPHGGPAARDDLSFDWWAQYYAALGYAVLQPNFRGSGGYGAEFREAGYGEFGGRMVRDVIDGAAHLVASGVARPGGYCAAGGSYGGYAALMTGLLDPDNVRCIVAVNSVTDPLHLVGGEDGERNTVSARYWEQYIGPGFLTEESRAEVSPLRRSEEFRAPILLLHGRQDITVDVQQSRDLAIAMEDSGLLYYFEMPWADHYFVTTRSRRSMLSQSRNFLADFLPADQAGGGRRD